MTRPLLIGLSGSLRRDSFTTAVLAALAGEVADRAELRIAPLGDVPVYNQDLDTDTPPAAVAALRAAIGEADGVVIATPEYNHGLPGMLKNVLDWASRPYGRSTLTGQHAFTFSASPGAVGGARAHAQLNETLASIGVRVVLRPQAVIASVGQKIEARRFTDRHTLDFLAGGIDDLLRDIRVPEAADREQA
jgi:chromate reductase